MNVQLKLNRKKTFHARWTDNVLCLKIIKDKHWTNVLFTFVHNFEGTRQNVKEILRMFLLAGQMTNAIMPTSP